jgi:hypothetical protein
MIPRPNHAMRQKRDKVGRSVCFDQGREPLVTIVRTLSTCAMTTPGTRTVYYVAASLDGFIATEDDSL